MKYTVEDFIKKAKEVHLGENLDYSEVVYINMHTKVKIIDRDLDENGNEYGEYWQEPAVHLNGCGHPKKGMKKKNDGYRYVVTSKDGSFKTYDIENKSGELTMYVENKLGIKLPSAYKRRQQYKKTGIYWWEEYFDVSIEKKPEVKKCPYCEWTTIDINNNSGAFEIHLKSHGINKNEYLKEFPEERKYFSLCCLTKNRQLETDSNRYVECAICGKKLASIDSRHLSSHGITKQEYIFKYGSKTTSNELHDKLSKLAVKTNENMEYTFVSEPESKLIEYIKSLGFTCERDRKLLHGKEIDALIPEKSLAIEFDGNKFHTEKYGKKDKYYHLNKTEECKNNGINLIHIFEDEYFLKNDIVKAKLRHILGADTDLEKVFGRKCIIKEINKRDAFSFLEQYHIQGPANSSVYIGAFYDEKLIAVMTFKKENKSGKNWELNRFASDYNYTCCGVGGKLFSYFIKNFDVDYVKSFMDRRWCHSEKSNIYTKLGFVFEKYTYPEYRYYNSNVNRYKRFHKFNFRKNILNKKYGLDLSMTEREMTEFLGYDKIWDCGLIKYVWKKEKAQANA